MVLKKFRSDQLFSGSRILIALAVPTGVLSYFGAEILVALIHGFANFFFKGVISVHDPFPLTHSINAIRLLIIPFVGALILGFKARYIDQRIRGHGIPEVIERFHKHAAMIPLRLLFLRPLASALSIGSGGPYGAEGPVIGLGSATGSALGQLFKLPEFEMRTLLCAGAAAGVSAIFGTPVAAIFLVLELFLKSHSIRSLVPVALASLTAFGCRVFFHGSAPLFTTNYAALIVSHRVVVAVIGISALVGIAAALTIHWVELLEAGYERLPFDWKWWPVCGVLPLAIAGIWQPRLLGPSYDMIAIFGNSLVLTWSLVFLCLAKGFLWSIAVSSRTTGGTLAPLFITGGGLGAFFALLLQTKFNFSPEFVQSMALISAGSFFGAIAAVPVSATFLILEMTGRFEMLPITLLASITAVLVTRGLAEKSIMSTDYN